MRGQMAVALWLFCGLAGAQQTTTQRTDGPRKYTDLRSLPYPGGDYRPPVERVFPQAWYDAARAETTMVAPTLGTPLSARLLFTVHTLGKQGAGEPEVTSKSYEVWQDSAGRARLVAEPKYNRSIPETNLQMTEPGYVYVFDPVARCVFSWREDGAKHAYVSCMQTGKAFTVPDAWDMKNADEQAWRKLHPDAQSSNEPMGTKKMFGIVEGEGYRHYETAKDYRGKPQKMYWGERWYAPSLKALVMSTNYREYTPEGGAHGSKEYQDFEGDVRSLAEPDKGLFYPPIGYSIEVMRP